MERQPSLAAGSLLSYGACASKDDAEQKCEQRSSQRIFTDTEILTLPLIVFSMCFLSFSVFNSVVVGILSALYGTAIAGILTYLSWERSRAWRGFCLVLWLVVVLALGLGIACGRSFPRVDGSSNDRALIVSIAILMGLTLVSRVVGEALPNLGWGIVGSSATFAAGPVEEGRGWGWEPLAAQNMRLGWDACEEAPDRVIHDLLFKRGYWSGEPAVDYLFFLAQEHLYMSCFLCHPWHPFGKFLRCIVAAIVSCLIVWPVALMAEIVQNAPLRLVLTIILVTAPRNLLKASLRKIAVAPQMLKVKDEASIRGGKFRHLVRKHITQKKIKQFDAVVMETRQAYTTQKLIAFVFFSVCLTGCVIHYCTKEIKRHSQRPLYECLKESSVGLLFAFSLELLIQLIFTARQADGPRRKMLFCGFFHRWWVERCDYGKLRHIDKLDHDDKPTFFEMVKDAISMAVEG